MPVERSVPARYLKEMSKQRNILAIGDIHNKWALAQTLVDKYLPTHKIIFVGDYFDDFNDTPEEAEQTAHWLKSHLDNPNMIFLLGNHDINYHYKNIRPTPTGIDLIYSCAGYSVTKDAVINRVLSTDDWDKFKFAHKENGFWFSHAGFHPHWFANPVAGMTDYSITAALRKVDALFDARIFDPSIGAAGRCRGGDHPVGGLLWRDHARESYSGKAWNDTSGIKQILGHTPLKSGVDVETLPNGGACINVDCGLMEVLAVTPSGETEIIPTQIDNFYYAKREGKSLRAPKYTLDAYDAVMNSLNKS